jgi:hypothetical protein
MVPYLGNGKRSPDREGDGALIRTLTFFLIMAKFLLGLNVGN